MDFVLFVTSRRQNEDDPREVISDFLQDIEATDAWQIHVKQNGVKSFSLNHVDRSDAIMNHCRIHTICVQKSSNHFRQ